MVIQMMILPRLCAPSLGCVSSTTTTTTTTTTSTSTTSTSTTDSSASGYQDLISYLSSVPDCMKNCLLAMPGVTDPLTSFESARAVCAQGGYYQARLMPSCISFTCTSNADYEQASLTVKTRKC